MWRRGAAALLAVLVVLGSGWAGYALSLKQGLQALRLESSHRLDLFASAVEGVVKRLEHVPATIQLNPEVLALLRSPSRQDRVDAVNIYLRRLNAHLGSLAVFVLDERGVVLSSSNADKGDDSLVGEDLAFRPYFLEALSGRVGRHFAIGAKSREPGYFVSHPIRDGARVVGVATIKISLEPIEATWDMLGAPALLADLNQVVILSSQPEWRYTALTALTVDQRVDLQMSRLFDNLRIERFPLQVQLSIDTDSQVLEGVLPGGQSGRPRAGSGGSSDMLVLGRALDGMDWRLLIFSSLRGVQNQALLHAMLLAIAAGFVLLLALYLNQRRRILRQKLDTQRMLRQANVDLEQKVNRRTRALSETNTRLRHEVAERQQAEQTLRAAQDELVHAGKMAVLGQLATGITHELTQPLGAIRTLSGNASEFLRRGDLKAVAGNLGIVARLADQMGSIIEPLKGFARKSAAVPAATDVAHALGNALFLYDQRLRKEQVEVRRHCRPGQAIAWCDPNRLEQVLINLVGNAIDAMADAPVKVLTLDIAEAPPGEPALARAPHGELRLQVRDSGAGFTEAQRLRLFEPFFTTKDAGVGLGLGLAISRDIVREFGGEIEAERPAEGGALFTVRLPCAPGSPAASPATGTDDAD
ncbi:two-component system C4-dicarboxylate transport sensor histidine kinase DctB [Sphaerotilus hippei]|uniref:C4-dicarboxylate transport sensor protein DctB n=2 Tax=Sphaerotilus hippei TaxID=744406 RepID=A0A318H103_9BURK|nr:two-component system C4-dicarboxylate transport sensor histidine kinase DctB [Sphaerotilus hippei]